MKKEQLYKIYVLVLWAYCYIGLHNYITTQHTYLLHSMPFDLCTTHYIHMRGSILFFSEQSRPLCSYPEQLFNKIAEHNHATYSKNVTYILLRFSIIMIVRGKKYFQN
jgi:hypothetical protein